jgi:catechol 2,3-dioxygenase-like lactoylglutathione lyase family enzyme
MNEIIQYNQRRLIVKFSNVRLLVKDYRKCFNFYTEKLGFEAAFDVGNCYASFKVADGIEGLAIFTSDYFAPIVGNAEKIQPVNCREKSLVSFEVKNVDETYKHFLSKGLTLVPKRPL